MYKARVYRFGEDSIALVISDDYQEFERYAHAYKDDRDGRLLLGRHLVELTERDTAFEDWTTNDLEDDEDAAKNYASFGVCVMELEF